MKTFPRQDIPNIEKNDAWYKQHLDYAEELLRGNNELVATMDRLYNSYNGVKPPLSIRYLTNKYGQENKSKYIAYRLGRTKLNLLYGEWLKRPLAATVQTINTDAVSEKMRQIAFMTGAMVAQEEIGTIKEELGYDVMEGVPVPRDEDDPIWQKMSVKDKCEDIMQTILDDEIKSKGIKRKIAKMFQDVMITSMCYAKIEIDEEGDVQLYRIDPRDAIYEHIEGDDFLLESPIRGCRQWLSVHEILRRYNLTDDQRNQLDAARANPSDWVGTNGYSRGYMSYEKGTLLCSVVHIEWLSCSCEYYKMSPRTKSQMELDPIISDYEIEMDSDYYEKNVEMHKKKIAKGEYRVETKWKEDIYEATRIGGIIDVNLRRKPFQKRSVDSPAYVLDSSYIGCIFNSVDGIRVSLQQEIENFDNMFDICMYQILKELNRAKGKVLTYDRAALPEKRTMEQVIYQVENDSFLDYNSAAEGNYAQRNLDPANMFKELDLGLSQSFQFLLQMKQDIMMTLNQITGINENREGNIAASSTATNAQSAIANSRTITEPMFFLMNEFVQKLLGIVTDKASISWAFYKLEKGEQILGTSKHRFLQVTKEIGYRDYGVHIEDGSRYSDIRQRMRQMAEFSLNAKEIRPMDVLKLELAETTAEMKAVLTDSWTQMQKAVQESQERQLQVQNQMTEMKLAQDREMFEIDREDKQVNEKDNIILQGQVDMEVDNNAAKNKMFETQQKDQNTLLNNM